MLFWKEPEKGKERKSYLFTKEWMPYNTIYMTSRKGSVYLSYCHISFVRGGVDQEIKIYEM